MAAGAFLGLHFIDTTDDCLDHASHAFYRKLQRSLIQHPTFTMLPFLYFHEQSACVFNEVRCCALS